MIQTSISTLARVHLLSVITLFTAASLTATATDSEPPAELCSRDHRYCVTILDSALPGADPDNGFFTIAVRSGRQFIAKYPTIGFLLDAFWSPDGKYVAVDNRRANSGDYLWVFRLRDGRAIRMPVDAVPGHSDDTYERYAKDMVQRVTSKFPELTYGEFNKLFTFAHAWTKSGELEVKTNFGFRNLQDQIAFLLQTYKIVDDKLVLIHETVSKAPWPPKKG